MEKLKKIVCALFGHSNIITTCFGYIYCARCGAQVGDSLGGYYDNPKSVIVGHKCGTCKANYKRLSWKDKLLAPNPFSDET
jgi:hypothetical protein